VSSRKSVACSERHCTKFCSLLPKNIQTVLFSATFPPAVINYATKFAPNANVLTLAHEELTIEGIKQLYIDIDKDTDKYSTLLKFYGLMTQASSIIFVRVSSLHSHIQRSWLTCADSTDRRRTREAHDRRGSQGRAVERCFGGLGS
jgi:superfamily II DNA/RNA helicase